MDYFSFCVWHILLSIVSSKFITVVENRRIFFLLYGCIMLLCVHVRVCGYHKFFIYSFTDGHLDGFPILAIVNKAGMNIGV